MLNKAIALSLVLVILLSSCATNSSENVRKGEWDLHLYNGYTIAKINPKGIVLSHRESAESSGGIVVLPRYFITAYQLYEPYICLEGFCTGGTFASDEELASHQLSYYVIDGANDHIAGPFNTELELSTYCESLFDNYLNHWISVIE